MPTPSSPIGTVTWRQAVAAVVAALTVIGAVAVVVGSDGFDAVDAASARATRWFVHEPTNRVVLVDGYGGRAVASLEGSDQGDDLAVVEGGPAAFILNDTTSEVRAIDTAELRLGAPVGITTLGTDADVAGVGQAGLVVVNPPTGEATLVPTGAEPLDFDVVTGSQVVVAPDGAVWSIVGGGLVRTTSSSSTTTPLGLGGGARLSLVGNEPLVLDPDNARARLGDGAWQPLEPAAAPSELVVQQPGPSGSCGWVGADDSLWCVGTDAVEETAIVAGLDIDGSDALAIAGDAAAVVRRFPSSIVQFDWRSGTIIDETPATVASDAALAVSATTDLVWIDDTAGDFVWAVNPWSVRAVDKNPAGVLVLGDDGDVVDEGESSSADAGTDESAAVEPELREPDDNGVDDPPVAVDDPVTARAGAAVPVEVTANDYDPDGEAVAVAAVGVPGHGTVDIGTATTVVYSPEPGYVGVDEFTYTIVDGDGTEAVGNVVVELLAADATNSPPVGVADDAETGAGVPVIVEVLRNDVDPERDSLRIGSFSPPEGVGEAAPGEVTETVGPTDLPALRFEPADGFEGTAIFSYRPIDALDAVGEDVEVRVEVARAGDANRPPVARPDAVRARRGVETPLPVLVNDVDPDGDVLALSVVEPLPAGLDVRVEGEQLVVTVGAGSDELLPFQYEIDDGRGHVVRAGVLVDVIDDLEPNRPPLVSADSDKAVVGSSVVIDVTENDVDPDGDPLVVVDVTQPDGDLGDVAVFSASEIQFAPAPLTTDDEQVTARFTYTVTDGHGHEVPGEVTVTVLPEALAEPPFARDDSTSTFVDVPVTVDVLRNDGDPSGGRPSLVGQPGCPSGGLAVVTTDSQVRFDPPPGRSGSFRCTYEVVNSQGLRASASIIVSVREPEVTNEPPDAATDQLTVEVGETKSIDVTANDIDPDGPDAELRVVSSTAPSTGSAIRRGNSIVFTAGPETGVTTINYQVADTDRAVALGRLVVRIVEPVNVAPIAVGDQITIFGPGVPTTFSVLANDSDPDQTPGGLSVVSADRVAGDGSVSVVGNTVTLSPTPSFVGDLVARYVVADGGGLTATATVTLTVNEPLNRPPEPRDDLADVNNGGTVSAAVLFNDVDPDGDPLTLSIVAAPDAALGSAVVTAEQQIRFTAEPGASGTASITYRVSDGELAATATLRVTVRPCAESAPVATDGFVRTGYQQPVAVNLVDYAANGTVVDVAGPPGYVNGVYTPPPGENGNVSITFAVVNSCRQRDTGRVTVDVNQDPVVAPTTVSVGRGTIRTVPVSELASDGEPLTIVGSSGTPTWVTTSPAELNVAPPIDQALANVSFTVTVRDPGGLTGVVPVTIVVANRLPVAAPDTVDVSSGNASTVDLVGNDLDPDGSSSELIVRGVPATLTFPNGLVGRVTLQPDGRSVTVDPLAGAGTVTFPYTVEDPDGGESAAGTVTVVGPRFNTPPFANDQSVDVVVGVPSAVTLDAGDVDGDPVVVERFRPARSLLVDRSGLQLTLTATAPGSHVITYRVRDDLDPSRTATVTVVAAPAPTTTPSTTTTTTTTPPPVTAAP